ncbi:MAG: NUDIX hydrolase [Elusimicrobia bacterium]|nr:NUDIX hydrolase [Elusimicrobiota bacterium]
METFVRRKKIYNGRAVNFVVDQIRLPDGRAAEREYLDHPGAVGVLPFLDADTILLVRQYRYPVRKITYEIPAGKLDPGESRSACLRRELLEETGHRARRVRPLISYWPTPAFSDEILHLYAADGLVAGPTSPDDDEFIEVVRMPFRRALDWVFSGKIRDSKTVIALLTTRALRDV